MTFLSKFERASAELRRVPANPVEDGITPEHTAAAAGLAGDDDEPDGDCKPDVAKAYRDASLVPCRAGEPHPFVPGPGSFARDPAVTMTPGRADRPLITDGHAAASPGYEPPRPMIPVAEGPASSSGGFSRPPAEYMTGVQSPRPELPVQLRVPSSQPLPGPGECA